MSAPLVLKVGGELLESPAQRAAFATFAAAHATERPVVVVHGGGRAIDAELARRAIASRKVDGLRITDASTIEAVVAVLAGAANTDLVAALVGRGLAAVGLTGVDAGFGRAARAAAHRTSAGAIVDLGLVGDPLTPDTSLIELLLDHRYIPVVASLGIEDGVGAADGPPAILNVNADVMACRLAGALHGSDLVIAGATPGVLDREGATIPELDDDAMGSLIGDGTATAGMIAKLTACRAALASGVSSIRIVDGRHFPGPTRLEDLAGTLLRAAGRPLGLGV